MWHTLQEFLAHEHVFFTHFPVALLVSGAFMRLFWAARPGQFRWDSSQAMLAIGAVSSFLALLSGLSIVEFSWSLKGPIVTHRNAAVALAGWSLIHLVLLVARPAWAHTRVGAALWALVGAFLAMLTGYLGGHMGS